jgi:hypothetical protein
MAEACKGWVQEKLLKELDRRIRSSLGEADWHLEVDPDMPDGQCLLFHYPSVFLQGGRWLCASGGEDRTGGEVR